MRLSYLPEPCLPGLATVLRGFDESAYRLVLNGKVMSKSSWDVVGFDGFDLLEEAPSRATLHVQVLQGDSSIQVGDGGGLPSGDGAGPGHSGGDGGHSGGDAGADAMAVAEAEAPADEAEEAEPFRHRKQDLFVKMLHDGATHAFSVSLSDTTVEELERLVKQRLESKQMSWTA